MPTGIQIGRGYIAVDLDERGARAALEAFKNKAEQALGELSKKRKIDTDTDSARKKIDRFADDAGKALANVAQWVGKVGGGLAALGVGALAAHAAAGGLFAIADAAAIASGAVALIPAALVALGAIGLTVAVGMQGLFDSMSSNAKKAQEAFNNLAPAAQETVKAIKQINGTDFIKPVQQALFTNMATSVRELGTKLLPVVRTGLTGVATELNAGARAFVSFLTNKQSLADTGTIFGNIRAAVHNLIPAGTAFGAALRDITTVGSTFLPPMAAALARMAQHFADFIAHARETGRLSLIIDNALAAFQKLGQIIHNVGSALHGIFGAGQLAGLGFLDTLQRMTKAFADWVHSVEGQSTLTAFFTSAGTAARALIPALKAAAEVIGHTIAPALASIGTIAAPALVALIQGIGTAIDRARPGIEAFVRGFADMVTAISSGASVVGRLASAIGSVLGPVLSTLGGILQSVVVPVLNAVASVIEHTSGTLTALVIGLTVGVVAWKALSGAVSLASGAFDLLKPSKVAEGLSGMGKAIDNAALGAAVMTEKFTGSAGAGEKVASAGSKVGGALTKVGSYLPIVGFAAVALGAAFEAMGSDSRDSAQRVDDLAQALFRSKGAIDENVRATAAKKLQDADVLGLARELNIPLDRLTDAYLGNKSALDEVNGALSNYTKELEGQGQLEGQVAGSNPLAEKAAKLQIALAHLSPEFGQAQQKANDLAAAQGNAADKAHEHERALYDVANAALASANADLQYRQAKLGIAQAQETYNKALSTAGTSSLEVQAASLALENAYLRTAEAARQKAIAEAKAKGVTDTAAAANAAYTGELLGMAIAAGSNAPPALQGLIRNLSNAELQAWSSASATSGFKTQVFTLPDGRTVRLAVDDRGTPVIQAVAGELASMQDRTVYINIIRVHRDVGDIEGSVGGRAIGGPMRAGRPYLVGERGPELVFPDRSGYVATATQTQGILDGSGSSGGGVQVQQVNNFNEGLSEQHYADIAATRLAWDLRFVS